MSVRWEDEIMMVDIGIESKYFLSLPQVMLTLHNIHGGGITSKKML